MPGLPIQVADTTQQLPEWVLIVGNLGPTVTLVAAFITAYGAWRTLREQNRAGRTVEWWSRVQWAVDSAVQAPDKRRRDVFFSILNGLATSELATSEDRELVRDVARQLFVEHGGLGKKLPGMRDPEP